MLAKKVFLFSSLFLLISIKNAQIIDRGTLGAPSPTSKMNSFMVLLNQVTSETNQFIFEVN